MTQEEQTTQANTAFQDFTQKRALTFYIHCLAYWLLLFCIVYTAIKFQIKQANSDMLLNEVNSNFIWEKNQLKATVSEIVLLKEQKKIICDSIPLEARTDFEKKICG